MPGKKLHSTLPARSVTPTNFITPANQHTPRLTTKQGKDQNRPVAMDRFMITLDNESKLMSQQWETVR